MIITDRRARALAVDLLHAHDAAQAKDAPPAAHDALEEAGTSFARWAMAQLHYSWETGGAAPVVDLRYTDDADTGQVTIALTTTRDDLAADATAAAPVVTALVWLAEAGVRWEQMTTDRLVQTVDRADGLLVQLARLVVDARDLLDTPDYTNPSRAREQVERWLRRADRILERAEDRR